MWKLVVITPCWYGIHVPEKHQNLEQCFKTQIKPLVASSSCDIFVVGCISSEWDTLLGWSQKYHCLSRRDVGYASVGQEINIIWGMSLNYEVLFFPAWEVFLAVKTTSLLLRTWCSDCISSSPAISRITLHHCHLPKGWSSGKIIFDFHYYLSFSHDSSFFKHATPLGWKLSFLFMMQEARGRGWRSRAACFLLYNCLLLFLKALSLLNGFV